MGSAKKEAYDICRKWVDEIGIGFHPDNLAFDYSPPMPHEKQIEYTLDMMLLFLMQDEYKIDPYEIGLEAMEDAKLI